MSAKGQYEMFADCLAGGRGSFEQQPKLSDRDRMQLTDLRLLQERRQPLLIHGVTPGCKEEKMGITRREGKERERKVCAGLRGCWRNHGGGGTQSNLRRKNLEFSQFQVWNCPIRGQRLPSLMSLRGNEGGV
jgi:hypothetical protein